MKAAKIFLCIVTLGITSFLQAQQVHDALKRSLEPVYENWRQSMIQKNHVAWKANTALNRKITIYNRIVSAYQPYPQSIFKVPFAPPALSTLTPVNINMKEQTAIATYFGKIDFGVGGEPGENLMVLYFVGENGQWKYDTSDFINLVALPDVRKQLLSGDKSYVKQKDFMASGKLPTMPTKITKRGYIAQVYAFCPGREVKVDINNGRSSHRFQNDKAAQVVIGGLHDGQNPITITTKALPGSTGNESINIRVFLMSQIQGVKPITVFDYSVKPEEIKAGKKPMSKKIGAISITPEHVKAINTK